MRNMRALAWALCCIMAVAGACGGAVAPGTSDAGSGSSSDASTGGSSGPNAGSSSGEVGSSSGPVTGSGSGPSGSSSTGSGGIVDAMATGCAKAPPPMEAASCSQCIATFCEDTWCACAGDSLDDGGHVVGDGCMGYVDCVLTCAAHGSLQACGMQCAPGNSQQITSEGDAFAACMAAHCMTATTCPNYG